MAKSVAEVQELIFNDIEAERIQISVQKKEISRDEYLEKVRQRCRSEKLTEEEVEDIVFLVDKSLWGFGLLDALVNMDDTVSDIRLIDENNVRIKRHGKRESADLRFNSVLEYERYIEFITNRNQTTMSVSNAAQVFTDKDSSPTNILRFTLASGLINTTGKPTLLIRKIPKQKKDFNKLIEEKFMTEEQREYIERKWKEGHGFLICGPNGSGKTTLTNAILDVTALNKSAVVMQESEELFCNTHPEMVFRKVIPKRGESAVHYDLQSLARLALMESFDILVVGEIKGGEAAYLAYSTYTGSQCMTTVHSISAKDGYEKIIDYALEEHPERDRDHFAKQLKSLDIAVYVEDYKIKEVVELIDYDSMTQQYEFLDVKFSNGEESMP